MTDVRCYQSEEKQEEFRHLVNEFAPLVKRVATQIKWNNAYGLELDDLMQSGLIGLLEAKANYSPCHNASFKTYATMKIRYAIYEALRKHTGITREISQSMKRIAQAVFKIETEGAEIVSAKMVAKQLGVSREEYARMAEEINAFKIVSIEDLGCDVAYSVTKPSQNPLFFAENEGIKTILKGVLNELPKREQLILSLYYNELLGFKEIGDILNLSEARISQIHAQLLIKLKSRLANRLGSVD